MADAFDMAKRALEVYEAGFAATAEWHKKLDEAPYKPQPSKDDPSRGCVSPLGGVGPNPFARK